MPLQDSCCTCATLLSDTKVPYDPDSEKPLLHHRRLECCGRYICALCQHQNPRFQSYCPFCQISSGGPSALPREGLRLPPSYTITPPSHSRTNPQHQQETPRSQRPDSRSSPSPPPSYNDSIVTPPQSGVIDRRRRRALDDHEHDTTTPPPEDPEEEEEDDTEKDTIHHVGPDDSLQSLSLAYKVPTDILRRHNNLYSDQLLAARKSISVPRSHYDGPPLSNPPDPDEEERKTKLRRWMVATKCADYNVATLYLKGSDYALDLAVEAYKADEEWERNHPLQGKGKGKGAHSRFTAGSISGQLS